MTLEAGSTLGHYEIVSSLGAGGMGEVYRATFARSTPRLIRSFSMAEAIHKHLADLQRKSKERRKRQ